MADGGHGGCEIFRQPAFSPNEEEVRQRVFGVFPGEFRRVAEAGPKHF